MGFQQLFYPKAVAVFGSMTPGKLGGILAEQIKSYGFDRVYAVNPKGNGREDLGIRGFHSLEEIDDTPELAVIATPAATVPGIMENCGQYGIRAAVIISSGFSEAGNAEGEKQVKAIADQYGMCFIGPNCAGLINTHHALAPTLQAFPPKGFTAVISQSGAVGGAIMEWAGLHNLGISKFASYGNGADLNQVEFLRYLKDDPETSVVAVYIETVNNGEEFMQALRELTAVKPVIALKSGRSQSGQRAALSHTGSMAGADAVYDAAFEACGAIRVNSLDELIDLCKGFSYLPPVTGRRVAIVTNSGGPGVMTTDLGESLGLDIADTPADMQERLRSFLPAWAGFHNPIDMTVEGTGENYRKVIEEVLTGYDACVSIAFCPPYLDTSLLAKGMLEAFRHTGKPVLCALETGNGAKDSMQFLADNGLPNFPSTERAITVAANMLKYHEYREHLKNGIPEKAAPVGGLPKGRNLLEYEAMELLSSSGISVPPFRFVQNRSDIGAACAEIGYPVVIKVVSPEIIHKSDVGGVHLNVRTEEEALAAFDHMESIASGKDFRGVMVYPMLKKGTEVILGMTRDRQFGPVVAFGMGGIFTEVLKDITLRIAPVSEETARKMVLGIRSHKILEGIRGQAGVDIDALAKMVAAFSQLPFRYPEIKEIDLNPVFAYEGGAMVSDARIILG